MNELTFSGVQTQQHSTLPPLMVILMKPLFTLASWFGVFPLSMDLKDPDKALFREIWSWNYIRSLIIFSFATVYMTFQFVSLLISISNEVKIVDIIGQSLWLQAGLISYLVTLQLLLFPQDIIKLYTSDWRAVEMGCGRVFSSPSVRRFARNSYVVYAILGVTSTFTVVIHSWQLPTFPTYVLHYIHFYSTQNSTNSSLWGPRSHDLTEPHQFTTTILVLHAVLQVFIVMWKWIGSAMLDAGLCVYGYVVSATMLAALNHVNEVGPIGQARLAEESEGNTGNHVEDSMTGEILRVDQIAVLDGKAEHPLSLSKGKKPSFDIMMILAQYQKLGHLVSDINRTMGPLLLIDFAQMIVIISALVFLPIKYSTDLDWSSTFTFTGNAVVYVLRLSLLTISLGDIYPVATEVNTRIARFLVEQRDLPPEYFNPILAHLSVFSASPISFNAWGFFPITRGTLLATFSVISTYIVVLLQV